MDTALVLLLTSHPADLDQFISAHQPVCSVDRCRGPLLAAGLSAQLGRLLLIGGDGQAALTLWEDVIRGRQEGEAQAAIRWRVEALAR